jgi:hypothetical protein
MVAVTVPTFAEIGVVRIIILSIGALLLLRFIADRLHQYILRTPYRKEQKALRRQERLQPLKQSFGRVRDSWNALSDEERERTIRAAKGVIHHAASSTSVKDFVQRVTTEPPKTIESPKKDPPKGFIG